MCSIPVASPFPGKSLARYWDNSALGNDATHGALSMAISEVVPIDPLNPDPLEMVKPHWPLAALNQGGWTYIRREGDIREELFQLSDDPRESRNLAATPDAQTTIERMRTTLGRETPVR